MNDDFIGEFQLILERVGVEKKGLFNTLQPTNYYRLHHTKNNSLTRQVAKGHPPEGRTNGRKTLYKDFLL